MTASPSPVPPRPARRTPRRARPRPHTGTFPKPLTGEVVQAADIVITMGCGDAWPVVSGLRDEIDTRIAELLDSLPSA